jgi:L-aminopeptidase/D-esterase-like protein
LEVGTVHNAITDVVGIRVGHWTNLEAATGCTVILCERGSVAGVDVRGPAPGTRETDLLRPGHLVERVHAVLLSGGSAFGLAAAEGVMRYLEEQGVGFDTGVARVPIVPAAILFDLAIGRADVRPDVEAGYQACLTADDGPVAEGNVGAGTGATVGKLLGPRFATKAGLGMASQRIGKGVIVGAIVAVNAVGDVVDPQTGEILAGARKPVGGGFLNTAERIKGDLGQTILAMMSTTIGVVATNAQLTKEQVNLVAMMAQDGLARAIRPAHTMLDGDTLFALSLGERKGDVSAIGTAAADVVAQAIVRAVRAAEALHGVPAHRDLESVVSGQ